MKENSPSPVRLKAVAKLAGVSMTTASSVLNGHGPRLRIAPASIERVQLAAKELGYHANPFASGLRMKRSYCIGVLWSFGGPYATQLFRCFSTQAMQHGYNALVYDSMSDANLIASQLKQLKRWRVDGLIIQLYRPSPLNYYDEIISELRTLPNVFVATNTKWDMPFPGIIQSMENALLQAVRHLLRCGRKNFAVLGHLTGSKEKIDGIRRALNSESSDASLAILDAPEPTREGVEAILSHPEHQSIDAILAGTDEVAAAAILALRKKGKRIPEDVAVIGFNDSPFAPLYDLPIASIRRHDDVLGAQIMEKMIASIEKGELLSVETMDMDFVWRESAGGPPPGTA